MQLIGDGLLAAAAEQTPGVTELTQQCMDALQDRAWDGDAELVDRLDAALDRRPTPLLRPLPIDPEELADVLEGDPAHGGGRIDLQTHQVWPQSALDDAEELGEGDDPGDDPDRCSWVVAEGSGAGYRDMELFIARLDDAEAADRLNIAINGRGAFRRFKDVLARWPHLFDRWSGFSEDRRRGTARAWLAEAGYTTESRSRIT